MHISRMNNIIQPKIKEMIKNYIFFKQQGSPNKFQVPWKFKDVLFITLISYLSIIFLYPIGNLFLNISGLFLNNTSARMIFLLYLYNIAILFFPIIWINKYYKANLTTLGIKKGKLSVPCIILLGIGVGIASFSIGFSIWGHQLKTARFFIDNFYSIILSTLTFLGFQMYLLAPISEEILDRGFLYGYLRGKVGVVLGLLIQALFFALSHPKSLISGASLPIIQIFFLGLLFGILYEVSGSLYPSIICHSMINFLNIIVGAMVK